MTAKSVAVPDLETYIKDDDYWFDSKIDGRRQMLIVEDGKVTGAKRNGEKNQVDPKITSEFVNFEGRWVFDCEYLNGVAYVFDLPETPVSGPDTPYSMRKQLLEAILLNFDTPYIKLVPSFKTSTEKIDLVKWCVDNNTEGVMIKHVEGTYAFDTRSAEMLKCKFVATADCIVDEVGRMEDGEPKRSIGLSVYDADNNFTHIGSCKVTERLLRVLEVGMVVEVRYLYATEDEKGQQHLYQCQWQGLRNDKNPDECNMEQLKFGKKIVPETTNLGAI